MTAMKRSWRFLSFFPALPLFLVLNCSSDDPVTGPAATTTATATATTTSSVPDPKPKNSFVANLRIKSVALFQSSKVPVIDNGQWVKDAAIVAKRPGLFRIYPEATADYATQEVTGRLTMGYRDGKEVVRTSMAKSLDLKGPSSDDSANSVIDIELEENDLQDDAIYTFELLAAEGKGVTESNAAGTGPDNRAAASEHVLKIVLVPYRYTADRSNREPDTSEAQIELYRKRLMQLYPATKVELTLHEIVTTALAVRPSGSGWDRLLDNLGTIREAETPASDVYYYGLFNPAVSEDAYCQSGCTSGLSNLASSPGQSDFRTSIGLGFSGPSAAETMVHEIGHAHGRQHAPCSLDGQIEDPDPKFPHEQAGIGAFGYDILDKRFVAPGSGDMAPTDFMSYCEPTWVSDYTYRALFDRMKALRERNQSRLRGKLARVPAKVFRISASGTIERTLSPVHVAPDFWNEYISGPTAGQVPFAYLPYSHLRGGVLVVPSSAPSGTLVALNGVRVRLP
jgi:hypothetical protein